MGNNEFFYESPDGQKQDADLHEGMLDNPEADEKQRRRAIVNAIEIGISREDAELLYGAIPLDLVIDAD